MTPDEIRRIIAQDIRVTHQPYGYFKVGPDEDLYLQVVFPALLGMSVDHPVSGRKWRLSTHMTKGEIVQTALLAVIQAQEHEIREHFLYKGKAIFGPHYDVDVLATLLGPSREDRRP